MKHKITLKMLAEYLGVSYNTVKQYRKDKRDLMMRGFQTLIDNKQIRDPRCD